MVLCVTLVVWTHTQARDDLSIVLEPLDDYCESTESDSGMTEVRWTVTGGQRPYEVWIAGERWEGASGVARVPCVGLRGRDIWTRTKRSESLNIVATVEDANGIRASDLAWIERVIEVQPTRRIGGGGYGGELFIGPGWFRVAGHSLWMPSGEWRAETEDATSAMTLEPRDCCPWWQVTLDLETGEEVERSALLNEAEHAALNAQVDGIVASIGGAPSGSERSFDGGVDTLTLELFAPAVCEASRWDFSRRRHPFEYRDHVAAEVEWRISGGQAPYTLYIAESEYEGAEGRLRIPCQAFADGVADSGLISIAALAQDANGATGSAIVQTYAVAETSGERYSEERLMNGGRTYRFEGIVMTIPKGLTIDVSDGFGSEEVSCGEGSCTDASCANELNDNVCENRFSLSTRDHSVAASFGYRTKKMSGRGWIGEDWGEDPGVNATSEAEIRELIDQWADSVGKGPDLSNVHWSNPSQLQISAYFTDINCRSHRYHDQLWANFRVVVSGGAWVPIGIEIRDSDTGEPGSRGRLIGLARGQAEIAASQPCVAEYGWQTVTLNVHDVAPDDAWAETEFRFLNLPARHADGSLSIRADAWQSEHERTPYCEPGSDVLIKWELQGATPPFAVSVNGARQDAMASHQSGADTFTFGQTLVPCLNRLGFQAHIVSAVDGSPTQLRVMVPVILQAVTEHPWGRTWSEIRGASTETPEQSPR